MKSLRSSEIDIAKGILIILVVIGHANSPFTEYIYWFHMPAFFFISGLLYRQPSSVGTYLGRKLINYGILYLSYFVILTIISFFWIGIAEFDFIKTLLKFFIGGRFIGRELGVFWFITCLFFTICIFSFLNALIRRKLLIILIIFVFYLLAHFESHFYRQGYEFYIPWSLDVSLISLVYFMIGYESLSLKVILEANNKLRRLSFLTISLLCFAIYSNFDYYKLDLKNIYYVHLIEDLFIPILFTFFVFLLSIEIAKFKSFRILSFFGYYSISIMFWHLAIFEIYKKYFSFNWIIFTLLGCSLPLIFAFIFDNYKITRSLFITGSFKTNE